MCKEIKFRYVCYNKHFKELSFEYLTDDLLREHDHVPSWIFSDNCEIKDKQLCTSIKDKNGKEIYEGDIIEKRYDGIVKEYDGIVKERLSKTRGVVECKTVLYIPDGFTGEWDDCVITGWFIQLEDKSGKIPVTNEFEIIGNIYEIPEGRAGV